VLQYLEDSAFSEWARGESLWGWPFALTVHALGTAVVIIPLTSLGRLFPVVWIAVVLQFMSGFTLWMTKPSKYVTDGAFLIKFSLVITGLVVTWFYFNTMRRESPEWEAKGAISQRGYRFVAATMVWWAGVLVAGRLTAYLGQLYAQ
jgi:hypothetical protein